MLPSYIYIYIYIYIYPCVRQKYLKSFNHVPKEERGVMVKALNCGIVIREFEFQ